MRSKLCRFCFKTKAAASGTQSAGNAKAKGSQGNAGNAKAEGSPDNAGNAEAKGSPDNAGNAKGSPDNAGNAEAKGSPDNAGNAEAQGTPSNAGNMTEGIVKKAAGERSAVKRSARVALVVKKQWVDKILAGEKDWEIRGSATARRGWIHFAESKAGGTLVGRARLMDCIRVPKATFNSHVRRHCVRNVADVPYKNIFAWVFEDAEHFAKPFDYKHTQGAVIWVKV
jgi:hypothetical protein